MASSADSAFPASVLAPSQMARVFAVLLVAGGVTCLTWLQFPHASSRQDATLLSLSLVTIVVGCLLSLPLGARVPHSGFVGLAVGSIALVSAAALLAGGTNPEFLLLFLWTAPWCFALFRRSVAMLLFAANLTMLSAVVAANAGLWRDPGRLLTDPAVSAWFVEVATLLMVSGMVMHLVRRARAAAAWFEAAYRQSNGGLVVVRPDGVIVSANEAFAKITHRSEQELVGESILDLVHPDDRADCLWRLAAASRPDDHIAEDVAKRVLRADGSFADVILRPALVSTDGAAPTFFVHVQDVTALRRSQDRALSEAAAARRRAEQQQGLAHLGRLALRAPVAPDLAQAAVSVVLSSLSMSMVSVRRLDREHHRNALATVAAGHGSAEALRSWSIPINTSAGSWGVLVCEGDEPHADAADYLDAVGNVLGGAADRQTYLDRLTHQSLHDDLTALPNRLLLTDRVEQLLTRNASTPRQVAVLVAGVDNFTFVNESFGLRGGDALLQTLADRLRELLPQEATLARTGGDQFAVAWLVPDGAEATALLLAHAMLDAAARPFELGGEVVFVSLSAGVALARLGADGTAEDLLRHADAACRQAKAAGRNRVLVHDELLEAKTSDRLRLDTEIRAALVDQRDGTALALHFQPVVELATGERRGLESLLRFTSQERGPVSPADFIPVAEETGLIVPLGRWALERAVEQVAAWGPALGPKECVCINVSARQLTQRGFAQEVLEVLQQHNVASRSLGIELTETALAHDPGRVFSNLNELRAAGLTILLDDFGTGWSSLAQLQAFPFDVVKIDRAFISTIETSPQSRALLEGIVSMAHALDLTVLAEGVETRRQADIVSELGCDLAQGYLFGYPLPPEFALDTSAAHRTPAHRPHTDLGARRAARHTADPASCDPSAQRAERSGT